MFKIDGTAIFCIEDGFKIIVSPMQGSDINKIKLYILGTCFGALLIQRRILPLHGSAISINGKAYAFIGESGAGKSTLASALLNEGHLLLSDDVIAVTFENGVPFAAPAYPQQKLWRDSMEHFGMESSQYSPLFERERKYAIPVRKHFRNKPLELAGIFELRKTKMEEVSCLSISKLEKLYLLSCHTYRNFFVNKLGLLDWHFKTISQLANTIDVFRISRPDHYFATSHLISEVLKKTERVSV
ncbi:aldolase [Bacillus sp. FJAT-42376]|uniref:aldolase n=1 Tax=Bacillus sp. FJAT-42376 TaxID=2014076 RepID=UPI001F1504B3|nr:aldolase [Bacillus sp. FJAT-42376]